MRRSVALSLVVPMGYAVGLAIGRMPHDRIAVSVLLFFLMTFSIADADFRRVRGRDALIGLAWSYLYAGTAVLLSSLLIGNGTFRRGFALLAFTPPALSSVAYATILGGDANKMLSFLSASYLAALLVFPLGTLILFGSAASPLRVALDVLFFIALPATLSPITRRLGGSLRRTVSVSLVFVIAVILSGGVRDVILSRRALDLLLPVIVRAWAGAAVASRISRGSVEAPIISGMRNGGLAAVTVMGLVGYEAAAPIILSGPFEFAIPGIADLSAPRRGGSRSGR